MKNHIYKVSLGALGAAMLLCSCATTPMGPTVQVVPGATIPFPIFQQDQNDCKEYAQSQVAGQAEQANNKAIGAAILTTALGAAVGAATSWHGHAAGAGAAIGAAAGGTIGASASQDAQASIQDQYNNAYVQCMYSKGNQVPGVMPAQSDTPPPPPVAAATTMTLAEAQEKLNSLGFPVGAADGHMGGRTRNALVHFQQSHGLDQTGELDPPTIQALSE